MTTAILCGACYDVWRREDDSGGHARHDRGHRKLSSASSDYDEEEENFDGKEDDLYEAYSP